MESEHDTPPAADLSPRELAAYEAIVAHVLAALIAKHSARKRAAARPEFTRPGQREVPELDDVALGTVSLKKGAESWGTDADWLDYVRDQFPEHVLMVESVSPSFTAAVHGMHKKGATWRDVDLVTGEERIRTLSKEERLPGITYKAGEPTLEIKPDWEAATAAVLKALGDNARLFGLDPKELEQ